MPSVLRDSAPDPRDLPPPEVAGALWPLPAGGPWEGGTIDREGRRWRHDPWRGWQLAGPDPYTRRRGRVYTSDALRRAHRRARRARVRARLARWGVAPALLLAAVLVAAGLVTLNGWWALAGLALAAVALRWALGR